MPYRSNLSAALAKVEKAKAAGSEAMVTGAGEESDDLVPVNTGRLKRSKRITKHDDGSSSITYGSDGTGVDYAAVVHNKPGVNYQHGQWQFLRQPLMNKKERLSDTVAAVRKVLK